MSLPIWLLPLISWKLASTYLLPAPDLDSMNGKARAHGERSHSQTQCGWCEHEGSAERALAEGPLPRDRMVRDGECPLEIRRLGLSDGSLLGGACAQQQVPRVLERGAGQDQGKRCSLLLREVAFKTGVVSIDEFAQSLHAFERGAIRGQGRSGVGVVENQREVVDPSTLLHKVEVQHRHHRAFANSSESEAIRFSSMDDAHDRMAEQARLVVWDASAASMWLAAGACLVPGGAVIPLRTVWIVPNIRMPSRSWAQVLMSWPPTNDSTSTSQSAKEIHSCPSAEGLVWVKGSPAARRVALTDWIPSRRRGVTQAR